MRGYTKLDHDDIYTERFVEFIVGCDKFDEEYIVPKIFRQFEKDYNRNPNKEFLAIRYELSSYMLNKLIRICRKRKKVGLHLI